MSKDKIIEFIKYYKKSIEKHCDDKDRVSKQAEHSRHLGCSQCSWESARHVSFLWNFRDPKKRRKNLEFRKTTFPILSLFDVVSAIALDVINRLTAAFVYISDHALPDEARDAEGERASLVSINQLLLRPSSEV